MHDSPVSCFIDFLKLIAHLGRGFAVIVSLGLWGDLRATTVVPPNFDELVNESDYIVRGVVKVSNSEFKEVPKGKQIVTKVEVDILEVIAGQPPAKVILEVLGGRVGDQEMLVEGMPRFTVGEEDIFFVSGNGRNVCPLNRMGHGRYRIEKEDQTGKKFVAKDNKAPLHNVAEVSQSLVEVGETARKAQSSLPALTPEQFIQQIKSAVNPAYRREKSN